MTTKLLTPEQFAEATHHNTAHIRQWCREGVINARQRVPHGRWLIPETEINRLFPLQEPV